MDTVGTLIVTFLVVFVIAYMFTHRLVISKPDLAILGIGAAMLVFTTYRAHKGLQKIEGYADATTKEFDIMSLAPIPAEEDYAKLIKSFPSVLVYLTAFNKASFPGAGVDWINVAARPKDKEECSARNKIFTFDNSPVFSKPAGLMLGSNRLYGPLSNELGISLQSTFTICFSCRHGDLVPDNEKEVEFLKLYANSSTNNGLALFVQAKSIKTNNSIQTGNLYFQFVDDAEPIKCLINPSDTSFAFDKLNMSMFFIVKDVDKVRVLYMVGESLAIKELAVINTKETVSTFSNKEMVINRFQNWKGGMYHVGIFPDALSDNSITDVYNHCYGEYKKANNADYIQLTSDYNSILDYMNKYTKCPYDDTVCKACGTVTNWTDLNQVMTAPASCRETIDQFCRANSKHVLCKCWDTTYAGYQSDSCKVYRNMFSGQARIFDNLTKDDITYIKERHGLITPEECPKPVIPKSSCVNESLKQNSYSDYEFDKIKIKPKFMDGSTTSTVDKPYSAEPAASASASTSTTTTTTAATTTKEEGTSTKKTSVDYVFKPVVLSSSVATPNADTLHAFRVPSETTAVSNIYKTDANVDFEAGTNPAADAYNKTTETKSPFFEKLVSFFLP